MSDEQFLAWARKQVADGAVIIAVGIEADRVEDADEPQFTIATPSVDGEPIDCDYTYAPKLPAQ